MLTAMWPHFLNLLGRSWDAMIRATGTTTLGFVVWTILITAVGWAATIAAKWFELKRNKTSFPFRSAMRDSARARAFTGTGIGLLVVATFCAFVVRTVYDDHEFLVVQKQKLISLNAAANEEVQKRKIHIYPNEPVFGNINSLLMAFDMYRHARHGEPCVIWISVPPTANSNISGEVAQFSNSVSDCFTFGPFSGGGNPEYDEEAIRGMVSDTVIFHATKDDKAAFLLFGNLGSLFKTKLSYELPSNIRSHYSLPAQIAGKEKVIWMQFGTEVKWNSERR
jgi:hypothetical protein